MSCAVCVMQQPVVGAAHLRNRQGRSGFTLIELLVSIMVIGILSALVFGALQRAGSAAKVVRTKSTIAKLNASLMDRWDSYRSRRLPVNPTQILGNIKANGGATYTQLQNTITAMSARRVASSGGAIYAYPGTPFDPLSVPWSAPPQIVNGQSVQIYPNAALAAAVRLLAMRETMKFEMPNTFDDFVGNFVPATSAGGYTLRGTYVLPSAPPIANTYLSAVNKASLGDPNASPPRPPATYAQIQANQSAECLYLILTLGSTDSGLFGEQLPTADVGDVDGDGLLEFQDAWPVALNSYTPRGQANAPIDFLRWAPGFISDLQPDWSIQGVSEFSLSHHDYFDPLKLDIPDASQANAPPRGFQLTPLIYSAGQDGLWNLHEIPNLDDPYDYSNGYLPGEPLNGFGDPAVADNLTNHELDTQTGK